MYSKNRGPYCYRISGQVYLAISQMQPGAGKYPLFSRIYIFDKQNELENRMKSLPSLGKAIIKDLQEMIKEVNPYALMYQQAADMLQDKPTEDVRLVLKTTRRNIDPRRYNLPTGSDVAVIIPMQDDDNISSRDVVAYKNAGCHPDGKHLMRIAVTHRMYDLLMHVLLCPFEDKGWGRK